MRPISRALSSSFVSAVLIGLTGCASTPKMSQADREAYLQGFVGQPSEVIYANLNLAALGYKPSQSPSLSPYQLSYTVERPIALPLTTGNISAVPIPYSVNASNGYNANMQCKIVFHLENNIASSMTYNKRTC